MSLAGNLTEGALQASEPVMLGHAMREFRKTVKYMGSCAVALLWLAFLWYR